METAVWIVVSLRYILRGGLITTFPMKIHGFLKSGFHFSDVLKRLLKVEVEGGKTRILVLQFPTGDEDGGDLPPWIVPSPIVRIWDIERGPHGQEALHSRADYRSSPAS